MRDLELMLDKAIRWFVVIAGWALIVTAVASADELPKPRVSEDVLRTLETRVDVVEKSVESLDSRVSALEGKPCPCDRGGKCICGDDCKCELCLEHLTNIDVVNLYAKHEEVISKIWESLPEEKTMRDAVKIWIAQQHARNNGVESVPVKASGVRVLLFTADWCAPCQAAKKRLGDMIEQLEVIDCTDGNPCPEYGEIRYPTALKIVDGKVVTRCEGEHVGRLIIGGWLEKAAGGELNREQKTDSPPAASRMTPNDLKAWCKTYTGPIALVEGTSYNRHLMDPNATEHEGGPFEAWQIYGLSISELQKIHGAQHEGYLTPFGPTEKKPVQDSRIEKPTHFSYQTPVMYRPMYFYTEPSFSQRFLGSSCPNCR